MNDNWMNGLQKKGLYYEGVVPSVDDLLETYKRQTVTTWGTRSSSNPGSDKTAVSCQLQYQMKSTIVQTLSAFYVH